MWKSGTGLLLDGGKVYIAEKQVDHSDAMYNAEVATCKDY